MLGERIAPQSEGIRAIVSGDSPCCGGARTVGVEVVEALGGQLDVPVLDLAHPEQHLQRHTLLAYSCSWYSPHGLQL